ncbi:hypothetical protein ACQY0O_003428 [Thecaphora frezii]
MDGHGLYGGNYPAQQQDLHWHQHPQQSNQPVQPWWYQHPSMHDHPAPVEEQQREHNLFRPVAQYAAHTPGQHHGLYGADYTHQHPPPSSQVEPTAQPSEPREYDFMRLLQHPGWSITESRSLQGANPPSQHAPSPKDWQLQIQPAPQHEPGAMDWEQQSQHAPQQYPARGQSYPFDPAAQAVPPGYYAIYPVQHAARHPTPPQQVPGLHFGALPLGQAQGHDEATSSLRPSSSGAFGRGGSSSPHDWADAHQGEHNMPAPTNPLVTPANVPRQRADILDFTPADDIVELRTYAEELEKHVAAFKVTSIPDSDDLRRKGVRQFHASDAQRDIIKILLARRFSVAVGDISVENENVGNDFWSWTRQFVSLMTAQDNLAWEFIGYQEKAFFFDHGDFRFRCTTVPSAQQPNPSPEKRKFKIIGFHKALDAPHWSLFIGVAELDEKVWVAAAKASKKRLEDQNFVHKKHGLPDI